MIKIYLAFPHLGGERHGELYNVEGVGVIVEFCNYELW